jgi:AcrR family transcriptional regulator
MSTKSHSSTKKPAPSRPLPARHRDERVRRTCERLGSAFLSLILEKPIQQITVQQVLDRASVGRSTFYVHYRDKNDLLLSQLERFCEFMSTLLIVRGERSLRVVPVTEMLEHIGTQNRLLARLSESGHLGDFFDLAQGYFARGIERRLAASGRLPNCSKHELSARASALAGSLLALVRWWLDHDEKLSPREVDDLYHRMVWNGAR